MLVVNLFLLEKVFLLILTIELKLICKVFIRIKYWMIGLEEYKKALGDVTDELSEEEILKARQIQEDLAEAFFPMWLETIKKIKRENVIISPLQMDEVEVYERK